MMEMVRCTERKYKDMSIRYDIKELLFCYCCECLCANNASGKPIVHNALE
jgi:hypothetical protein